MGMDVYGRKPKNKTGEYFRANIWSWKPIYYLCGIAKLEHEEKTGHDDLIPEKTFRGMEHNDGSGLRSERKCKLLSDYLQKLVDFLFHPKVVPHEYKMDDTFKLGVDDEGKFYLDFGENVGSPQELMHRELSKKGKVTFPEYLKDSKTPYITNKEHLQEFIGFLRNCGGFRVW